MLTTLETQRGWIANNSISSRLWLGRRKEKQVDFTRYINWMYQLGAEKEREAAASRKTARLTWPSNPMTYPLFSSFRMSQQVGRCSHSIRGFYGRKRREWACLQHLFHLRLAIERMASSSSFFERGYGSSCSTLESSSSLFSFLFTRKKKQTTGNHSQHQAHDMASWLLFPPCYISYETCRRLL